jgi:NAD(P)-dependent dehydrogenase (short-subunit alcohol dehydrogenase family)
MAFTADISKFEFGEAYQSAFAGKRVLITGSGKDRGIGQALALAAAANGAKCVGVHFHSSYRDGFDLVDAIRKQGVDAFALQADVTSLSDLWASRSYIIEHMGGKSPDIIVCNSGLSEGGYRFGRALPEKEGESRAERRVRVRQSFMDNLRESRLVMDTKIYGFVSWTHLWAGEAVYHKRPPAARLRVVHAGHRTRHRGTRVRGRELGRAAAARSPARQPRQFVGHGELLLHHIPVHPHRPDGGLRRQSEGIRPLAVPHAGNP